MLGEYTYIVLMLLTFLGPFVMSFEKKIQFKTKWKNFLIALIPMLSFFIVWDILFTINGVWKFNSEYILGIKLFHLPLEEWLFFIFVPYACVFIYENVKYFFKKDISHKYFSTGLIFIMLILLLYFENGIYTQITFISLIIMILISINKKYMFRFYLSYMISLLPFFIVNGILTSTPIVLYNDAENLSIRIGTIPIEDFFYGMLMILQVIYLYEILEEKK